MKFVFYLLAGVFVAAGLFALLSALNFPAALAGFAPLLSALGPIWAGLSSGLASLALWVGVILLVVSLGIAGLLIVAGRLLDGYLDLRARVARLEAELGQRGA